MRVILGTISLINSSCFPSMSVARALNPVTFPPGCARLATRPVERGSPLDAITMGIVLGRDRCRRTSRDDHVHLEPEQFFREARKSLWPTASRAILHDDVLSLRISEL